MARMGRKGGRKAARKLRQGKTAEELSAIMRGVINARWEKVRAARAEQGTDLEAAS